jgi:hypothetical protein
MGCPEKLILIDLEVVKIYRNIYRMYHSSFLFFASPDWIQRDSMRIHRYWSF